MDNTVRARHADETSRSHVAGIRSPTPRAQPRVDLNLIAFQSLRTLECIIRHMSYQKAAEELHVSPSAVSQQIKRLELQWGVRFFQRVSNQLILTDAGRSSAALLQDGMRLFEKAAQRIEEARATKSVRLSVAPSFAAKWLIPRLGGFRDHHPDIDLRIDVSMDLADFQQSDLDIAIRYGRGRYSGLESELLAREVVFPVCSPLILPSSGTLRPDELCKMVLLHDESMEVDPDCPNWSAWLASVGLDHFDCRGGLRINQSSLVIDAAVAGRGVALAKRILAIDDLRDGRIVRPFEKETVVQSGYYFVYPREHISLRNVAIFRDWVRAEIAEDLCGGDAGAAVMHGADVPPSAL